ncbi:MAG: hypothetical protein LBD17_04890 [Endomicrobium sp.]|jgi:cell filamentation protein|nr:hypothetical protein [Endomicrobium sp.]
MQEIKEVDDESLKNAYKLFETDKINSFEIGTIKGLQQIHKHLFDRLYDFKKLLKELYLQAMNVVLSMI